MDTIALIGAPSSAGAYAPGQERAPQALRDAGLVRRIEERGATVHDRGDTPHQRWSPDRSSPRAQNVAGVIRTVDALTEELTAALHDGGRALVLGGDCTVGMAAVRACGPGVGLIYLDMHADMNTPDSTIDGALDWMGVAHLLQLEGTVPALARERSLEPDHLSLLGFEPSQATPWELRQIAALGIATTRAAELTEDPVAAAQQALASLPARCERVVVHFDVDVIDFVDAPLSQNTGRNVGVTLDAAGAALAEVLRDPRVVAVTVTELNPAHGAEDGSTLQALVDQLAEAVGSWAPVPASR
jgi:arginase